MINYLVYAVSGKLLLFLAKKFPPIKYLVNKATFLEELYNCNLCFGFWIFLGLSPFFKDLDIKQIKNKTISNIVLSSFTTFIVHLVSVGWDELFGISVIDHAYRNGQSPFESS